MNDGTEHRLTFNLYGAETLRVVFAQHSTIADMRALDLCYGRFAVDAEWNSKGINALPGRAEVMLKLKELEETLCRSPDWVDHGGYVLIAAKPLQRSDSA